MKTIRCSRCKATLPETAFSPNNRRCRPCDREYKRERYADPTRRQRAIDAAKKWQQANKERWNAYLRRRYQQNKEQE